ncbi:MAG: HEAT repeat domain-containing protein [Chloroherpetonaceae bacterium]|nr:HEAT repeat domain-containing protein [Chloroherpetonaceae bacterium]
MFTFFLSFKLPTLSHSATQGFSKDFAQRALVRTIESLTDSTCRIDFNVLVPQELSGTVHDPRICALLARALAADQPLESRQQAFGILHQTPALLHQPDIRAALIRVVKYDLHTELRHNALNLLLQLPPTAEIGQALLYVLMNDSNAGLRIAAIDALARGISFSLDALSLSKLRTRLEQDENPYIRTNADALLERTF